MLGTVSLAENQFDLEMTYKGFSLLILVVQTLSSKNPSDDTVIIERFEKFKMAHVMAAIWYHKVSLASICC